MSRIYIIKSINCSWDGTAREHKSSLCGQLKCRRKPYRIEQTRAKPGKTAAAAGETVRKNSRRLCVCGRRYGGGGKGKAAGLAAAKGRIQLNTQPGNDAKITRRVQHFVCCVCRARSPSLPLSLSPSCFISVSSAISRSVRAMANVYDAVNRRQLCVDHSDNNV